MAHCHVEIIYDSRGSDQGFGFFNQTIVVKALIDPNILPQFPSYAFMGYTDDMIAMEYFYTILPKYRQLVTGFNQSPAAASGSIYLLLTGVAITQTGPNQWEATASYTYDREQGVGGQLENGNKVIPYVRRNWTIGGEKKRIFKALQVISTVVASDNPSGASPDDLEGAIGIGKDGAEGMEVPSSNMKLQITGFFNPSIVTPAYERVIRDTIAGPSGQGTVNQAAFAGYQPQEVQLLDASSGSIVHGYLPITFNFSIGYSRANVDDLGFPPIASIQGHEHVEYTFRKKGMDDSKLILLMPQQRRVMRIFDIVSYSGLLLPV